MASIYDMDIDYVTEKNVPPDLRKPVRLALLRVLNYGLKKKYNEIFGPLNSYANGDYVYPWSTLTTYNQGDNVSVGIERWECMAASSLGEFPKNNTDVWHKISDDFLGCNKRVNIYAGKMSMEYFLNLYLNNVSFAIIPLVYIATQTNATPTMMLNNNVAPYLNYMSNNPVFQATYMASVSTYTTSAVNFIVYVPSALFYTLGSTFADCQNVVRGFVDKWNTAGITYDVQPY